MLEVIEDRVQLRSTIVTSQLPVALWHEALGEPTVADGILDRLLQHVHRIELHGESMRRGGDATVAPDPGRSAGGLGPQAESVMTAETRTRGPEPGAVRAGEPRTPPRATQPPGSPPGRTRLGRKAEALSDSRLDDAKEVSVRG